MDHSYSNTGTASQQLTPPGASGPSTSEWYQNNHNQSMGQPTQPSSPMPLNPNANILEMHGMRNTLSTPSQAIPVTSDEYHPHWGQYGVSGEEPQDEMSPPLVPSDLFSHIPNVDPSNLMKGYTLPSTNHIALAPAPQVSILGPAPNSGALAPIAPIENYHHPNPFTMTHPPPLFVDVQRSSYKRNPRNANKTRNPPKKRQRGGNRKQSGPSNVGAYEEQAAITQTSPASPRPGADGDTPREVLQFRYDADHPENHDLLDLKMKHLSVKGRGMWDRIVKDWVKTYGTVERAALQMKLQRFVARQAIWPESEVSLTFPPLWLILRCFCSQYTNKIQQDTALKEAIEEYDKRRYKDILIIMKEKGGCRAWDWKMEHIAKRLVELGEEEFDPEMKPKKTRRRRKELQRQRQQPNLWNQPSPPSAYYDQQGLSTATRNELTAEEQERIFSSLFIEEQESQDVDAMDTLEPVPDSRRSSTQRELNQAHSERVAKQACEQLIAQQQQGSASFYQSQYTSQQNNTHTS